MAIHSPAMLLLLLPALALAAAVRISRPCRILLSVLCALVVAAMSRPVIRFGGGKATVIAVADRSDSINSAGAAEIDRAVTSLSLHRPSGGRLGVVSFAAAPRVDSRPAETPFDGIAQGHDGDGSDLDAAIDAALSLVDIGEPARIVVLSDGLFTGADPAAGAAARAAARGIPVDFRPIQPDRSADTAVEALDAPSLIPQGSALLATLWIDSPARQTIRYELRRNGAAVFKGSREIPSGISPLTFRDISAPAGITPYEIAIFPEQAHDSVADNNVAHFIVSTTETRPLLVAVASPSSSLPRAMASGGLEVVAALPREIDWSPEALSAYSGVVLENIPASAIGNRGLAALSDWVEFAGGGVALTGGRNSFGQGGYRGSPLEKALPVTMELRNERRKHRLAIAIAMDRSGSMGAPAGDGRTKMDLANLAAEKVVETLKETDEIAVFAVDTAAHCVLPLMPVSAALGEAGKIRKITSEGGGIFVYEALAAALRSLQSSTATIRHVILFADANDSEHPGDYQNLLAAAAKAGITASVVGLGTEGDSDAALLREVADWGLGTCEFTNDPGEIPRLFVQDTINVSRSAIVTNQTALATRPALARLFPEMSDNPPPVGGYNMCFLAPDGVEMVASSDENDSPLLSTRQFGLGRTLAFACEADGELTGPFGGWKRAGEFYASIARFVAGDDEDVSIPLLARLKDGAMEISAYVPDGTSPQPPARGMECRIIRMRQGSVASVENILLRWKSANDLSATIPIHGSETVLPVVVMPDGGLRRLQPLCRPYSPEFRPDRNGAGLAALRAIAAATGGDILVDVSAAWDKARPVAESHELAPWLYALAAFVLVALACERRFAPIATALARGGAIPSVVGEAKGAVGAISRGRRRGKPCRRETAAESGPDPAPALPPKTSDEPHSLFDEALRRARRR